jgi:DNA-binding response OmpR family regulator
MAPCNYSQQAGILAIDDELGFLGMLKEMLECQGYVVHAASSPREAIKLNAERWREISMVLLDFFLPGTSGDQVFEELQRHNPDVRVVLVTGWQESVADKMLKKGLRGYLHKPFGIQELGQKIQNAIDAPSPQTDISGNESQTASVVQKGDGATTVQLNEIWDAISAAPPLQQESTAQQYVGHPIDWLTRFFVASETDMGNMNVTLGFEGIQGLRSLIFSTVISADYPELKVLKERSRVRIVGRISEIGVSTPPQIRDAKLFFLPPSAQESA